VFFVNGWGDWDDDYDDEKRRKTERVYHETNGFFLRPPRWALTTVTTTAENLALGQVEQDDDRRRT